MVQGFQLGGQAYREVIFFENKAALDRFKENKFEFAAQVSAVAATKGASAN
ncbi:MAG: YSC84-related protein [Chitinophagaceae bacterium]